MGASSYHRVCIPCASKRPIECIDEGELHNIRVQCMDIFSTLARTLEPRRSMFLLVNKGFWGHLRQHRSLSHQRQVVSKLSAFPEALKVEVAMAGSGEETDIFGVRIYAEPVPCLLESLLSLWRKFCRKFCRN